MNNSRNLGGSDSHLRPLSCFNITWDWGCITCGDFCVSACIMHQCISDWDDVYISVTMSIQTRCRCVWMKIQMDVFISHFPESWLCASCPLPPMTQCPSAPKHSPTSWLSLDQRNTVVKRRDTDTTKCHSCVWTSQICSTTCGGYTNLILSCVFIWFLQSAKLLKYNHNKTWCIIGAENWVGIWRKVNFKHKGASVEEKKNSAQKVGHRSRHVRGRSREISLIQ